MYIYVPSLSLPSASPAGFDGHPPRRQPLLRFTLPSQRPNLPPKAAGVSPKLARSPSHDLSAPRVIARAGLIYQQAGCLPTTQTFYFCPQTTQLNQLLQPAQHSSIFQSSLIILRALTIITSVFQYVFVHSLCRPWHLASTFTLNHIRTSTNLINLQHNLASQHHTTSLHHH
jgi:hypothetical protein